MVLTLSAHEMHRGLAPENRLLIDKKLENSKNKLCDIVYF